jgi:Concanavalin A-like lectin/glucanases superfamily
MATTVARLSSNGVYFTNTYFNEITYTSNKVSTSAIYSAGFDEVSIHGGNVAKRETNAGQVLVSGYFDEVTGISSGTFIGSTASTTAPTLGGNTAVSSGFSPFSIGNSYYIQQDNGTVGNNLPTGGVYNYITTSGQSGYAFGTGDFTLEWFEYQTYANTFPRRLWLGNSPTWGFDIEVGTTPYFWTPTPNGFGSSSVTSNVWTHWAIVRISGSVKLYKNGTQVGSALSISTNFSDSTSTLYIGGKPSGYISEQFVGYMTSIRICKGIGVYTGNFTVPTSSLGQTQSANPYGGANTQAINTGQCVLLLNP